MKTWILALVACVTVFASAQIPAHSSEKNKSLFLDSGVEIVSGPCGNPCIIIHYSPGGNLGDFIRAANLTKKNRIPTVIDGPCASACVIFADEARPYVCITENATFYFHQATIFINLRAYLPSTMIRAFDESIPAPIPILKLDPPQSPDINSWVYAHHGYPDTNELEHMLAMPALEASKFWPWCT